MRSAGVLFLILFACAARADFVLSDGTIIVTGRSSIPSFPSATKQPGVANVTSVIPPSPVVTKSEDGDLVWNKWDSENFVILSLNKAQGQRIKSEVEHIRSSFFGELGVSVPQAKSACKIVCVPDAASLKNLFGLDGSHWETKKDSSGVASSAIWLNQEEMEVFPFLLLSVCLEDAFPDGKWCVLRGSSLLGNDSDRLRSLFKEIPKSKVEDLLRATKESWQKMKPEQRLEFDKASAAMCLLLRREFGRKKLANFFVEKDPVSSLGFGDNLEFDKTLARYSENLSSDVRNGLTPDKYLILIDR